MSIGGAEDLHTDKEREGSSVCQNCIQIITVVHVIIFNIHLSHSQMVVTFVPNISSYPKAYKDLPSVGHKIARPYIYTYVATYTLLRIATGSRQLTNVCLAQVRPNYIEY